MDSDSNDTGSLQQAQHESLRRDDVNAEFATGRSAALEEESERPKTIGQKILQFCTCAIPHVALILAVIVYLCLGALVFKAFEADYDLKMQQDKAHKVSKLYESIITAANDEIQSSTCSKETMHKRLQPLLEELSWAHEYDSRFDNETQLWGIDKDNLKELWSFPNSVFYALTVATSTGYERVSPQTDAGRLFTVVFGLFGIPLLFITAADIGKFFSEVVTTSYSKIINSYAKLKQCTSSLLPSCCKMRKGDSQTKLALEDNNADAQMRNGFLIASNNPNITQRKTHERPDTDVSNLTREQLAMHELGLLDMSDTLSECSYMSDDTPQLPVFAYFGIMLAYCAFGSAIFNWHETGGIWDFIYGFFFSFNAITTIGVGDIDGQTVGYTCMVVTFVIIGLAVITMCVDLASTQVKILFQKLHYFGRQLRDARQMFSDELLEAMQYLSALKDKDKVTLDDLAAFLVVQEKLKKRPYVPKNVYRMKFIDWDGIGLRPYYRKLAFNRRTSSLTRTTSTPSLHYHPPETIGSFRGSYRD